MFFLRHSVGWDTLLGSFSTNVVRTKCGQRRKALRKYYAYTTPTVGRFVLVLGCDFVSFWWVIPRVTGETCSLFPSTRLFSVNNSQSVDVKERRLSECNNVVVWCNSSARLLVFSRASRPVINPSPAQTMHGICKCGRWNYHQHHHHHHHHCPRTALTRGIR